MRSLFTFYIATRLADYAITTELTSRWGTVESNPMALAFGLGTWTTICTLVTLTCLFIVWHKQPRLARRATCACCLISFAVVVYGFLLLKIF